MLYVAHLQVTLRIEYEAEAAPKMTRCSIKSGAKYSGARVHSIPPLSEKDPCFSFFFSPPSSVLAFDSLNRFDRTIRVTITATKPLPADKSQVSHIYQCIDFQYRCMPSPRGA